MSSVSCLRRRVSGRALFLSVVTAAATADAQQAAQPLTLQQAIETAQRQGLQAQSARSARDAARARDRAFGSRLLPQVSLLGQLPNVDRSIIPVLKPDGTTDFVSQNRTQSSLDMRLSQPIPFTGGDFFIQSGITRLDVHGTQDVRSFQSTPVRVGLTQDILRPNRIAWDTREQNVRETIAERQYLEAREDVALATSDAFFDVYAAQTALQNQTANVSVNDSLFTLSQGRYEVGKIGENDLLQSELALLRARNALDGAKLEHARTLSTLRLALNVPIDTPLEIVAPTDIPAVVADTAVAVSQALRNRSQMTDQELQALQARRRVTEAKLNNGLGATITATAGLNQTAPVLGDAYRSLLESQQFGVQVEVPLVQWGGRRAQIEAARADQDRVASSSRAAREATAQEAHFAALQLSQAERQLALSAKGDTVAAKRFEVAKNRYVIGRIGIDNLYLAQNEKDQALLAYVQSLRNYWQSYYRLRRLTLYDFAEGRAIR
jgi:outer membrane protein